MSSSPSQVSGQPPRRVTRGTGGWLLVVVSLISGVLALVFGGMVSKAFCDFWNVPVFAAATADAPTFRGTTTTMLYCLPLAVGFVVLTILFAKQAARRFGRR